MVNASLLDGILLLVAIEFLVLSGFLIYQKRPRLVPALFSFLVSGAALMGAIRLLVEGDDHAGALEGLLLISFIAHLATLWLVWRQLTLR